MTMIHAISSFKIPEALRKEADELAEKIKTEREFSPEEYRMAEEAEREAPKVKARLDEARLLGRVHEAAELMTRLDQLTSLRFNLSSAKQARCNMLEASLVKLTAPYRAAYVRALTNLLKDLKLEFKIETHRTGTKFDLHDHDYPVYSVKDNSQAILAFSERVMEAANRIRTDHKLGLTEMESLYDGIMQHIPEEFPMRETKNVSGYRIAELKEQFQAEADAAPGDVISLQEASELSAWANIKRKAGDIKAAIQDLF